MFAITVSSHGGPEVLSYREVTKPAPSPDQVLVAVDVAGINFIDTYYRDGTYPTALPFIPGQEGTGRVLHDPAGTFRPGERVAWCAGPGSYAEQVCVPRGNLVRVPESIAPEVAASMLLQGITAHYLTHGVTTVTEDSTILVPAGAGGVGLLLTQIAKRNGARVITVVSTDAKEELSRAAGADEVLRYGDELANQVKELTGGQGVNIVFDGVGKATFAQSLNSLRRRGLMCLFGAASGPVDPLDPQELSRHGSLYLTRPAFGDYIAEEKEYRQRAEYVVRGAVEGWLNFRVGHCYPLADAARAHRDLHQRKTTGSLVLKVSGNEDISEG